VIEGAAQTEVSPWRERVYRWQNVIQLALVAVVFITPPMAEEESLLDLACDVFGAACVVAGALLRLGAAGHSEQRRPFARRLPTRVVTDGAYAYMRQPLALSTLLIGVGLVLLAESGPGLLLVPVALIMMYRITIPFEEAHLVARFGQACVDYCASVLRFPRATVPMFAAARRVPTRLTATAADHAGTARTRNHVGAHSARRSARVPAARVGVMSDGCPFG